MYGDGLITRSARYKIRRGEIERHVDAPGELHLKRVAGDDVLRESARRRRGICRWS